MYTLTAMLILSIIDAILLILFIKWSMWQQQRLNEILDEYKLLKKSTELYVLSPENQQKVNDFDDYFAKVFKSLQTEKENIMNRINNSNSNEAENSEADGNNMV